MALSPARVAARHAAIQLKPRDTGRYFSILARRIGEAARTLNTAIHTVLGVDEAHEWLRSSSNYDLGLDDFDALKLRAKDIDKYADSMKDRARDFPDSERSTQRDLVYYAHRSSERLIEELERPLLIAARIREHQAGLVQGLDDYRMARRVLDAVNDAEKALTTVATWLKDARGKFGELVRRKQDWAAVDADEPPPPASDEVEVLYHTSINARSILSKGFDPRGSAPNAGLGGVQDGISFTFDLHVAKEIMRCLREAILIANGDVTARDIFEWARSDGILDKVKTSYEGLDHRPPDNPVRTLTLYQSYLSYAHRYNPVFFGTSEQLYSRFHGKSERDVGILVCHVNVKAPGVEYYSSEEEFRAPPAAVVSVDRMIS